MKEINLTIISTFEDFYNPNAWENMQNVFKNAGYKYVYIRHESSDVEFLTEFRSSISFFDHEQLILFLEKERKLALDTQDFEWAAQVSEKRKSLNPNNKSFEGAFLKYTFLEKGKGICEISFKTNILSFKNTLINEFASFPISRKELNFHEFSKLWNDYMKHITDKPDFEKIWNNINRSWTDCVLSEELEDKIKTTFGLKGIIQQEWRKFDFTIGTDEQFENIYNYDLSEPLENNASLINSPKHLLLILEHENDFRTALNELIKLTYERAKVKVLVTYPQTIEHRLALITNTIKILDQSDRFLSEYSTEYILILGELIDAKLYWSFYQFASSGVLLNSHFYTNTGEYKSITQLTQTDFEKHMIWQDFNTFELNDSRNTIKSQEAVKPTFKEDTTIIYLPDTINTSDYLETYYVACKFFNDKIELRGYVCLSTNYDSRQEGVFETYMQPVIIDKDTQKHIRITKLYAKELAIICEKNNTSLEELFPLNYEIQAKFVGGGFENKGIISRKIL